MAGQHQKRQREREKAGAMLPDNPAHREEHERKERPGARMGRPPDRERHRAGQHERRGGEEGGVVAEAERSREREREEGREKERHGRSERERQIERQDETD